MKIVLIYSLAIVISFIYSSAIGQEVPEPEFALKPYYLKSSSLENFDRVDGTLQSKAKALGYGGVETFYAIAGAKASTRFVSSVMPIIVIKIEDNSDPADLVTLFKTEMRKDQRRIKSFKAGGFSSLAKDKDNKVKVSYKKLRDKVFQMVLDSPLEPGEYAFMQTQNVTLTTNQAKMSCFGID